MSDTDLHRADFWLLIAQALEALDTQFKAVRHVMATKIDPARHPFSRDAELLETLEALTTAINRSGLLEALLEAEHPDPEPLAESRATSLRATLNIRSLETILDALQDAKDEYELYFGDFPDFFNQKLVDLTNDTITAIRQQQDAFSLN